MKKQNTLNNEGGREYQKSPNKATWFVYRLYKFGFFMTLLQPLFYAKIQLCELLRNRRPQVGENGELVALLLTVLAQGTGGGEF